MMLLILGVPERVARRHRGRLSLAMRLATSAFSSLLTLLLLLDSACSGLNASFVVPSSRAVDDTHFCHVNFRHFPEGSV